MLSPRQIFDDNIRPADLLLKVYRLLEHDAPNTEAELHRALRDLVKADKDEGLMVIYSYLSGKRGIHVTGALLALDNPWKKIAEQLGREEDEIKKTLDATVKRRNDIVHRADRSQDDPSGAAQEIGYPWAKQAVETIRVVCLALDDLVNARLKELRERTALEAQGAR